MVHTYQPQLMMSEVLQHRSCLFVGECVVNNVARRRFVYRMRRWLPLGHRLFVCAPNIGHHLFMQIGRVRCLLASFRVARAVIRPSRGWEVMWFLSTPQERIVNKVGIVRIAVGHLSARVLRRNICGYMIQVRHHLYAHAVKDSSQEEPRSDCTLLRRIKSALLTCPSPARTVFSRVCRTRLRLLGNLSSTGYVIMSRKSWLSPVVSPTFLVRLVGCHGA